MRQYILFFSLYKSSAVNMSVNRGVSSIVKSTQPGWWDSQCHTFKRKKYCMQQKYRLSNDQSDFVTYKICRNEFKAVYRKKKIAHQSKKRQLLSIACNDPKSFWSLLKERF